MDFEHTEDRRMLADTLNRYLAEQAGIEVRHAAAASPAGFNRTTWQGLAELGALGALFPESAGGLGGSGFDVAVVFECLGRALAVEPLLGTLVVGQALLACGAQPAQLERLVDGSTVATWAHDEADGHYALHHVATLAERKGNAWVLNGHKAVVVHGDQADLLLVSARTGGAKADAPEGITLFLVPGNAPGVQRRGNPRIDGGRTAEVTFTDVHLDDTARLGDVDHGLPLLERATGWGLLALCAEALGAMEVAKAHTLDYLRTRRQFGVPIGSFQALQHRMADLLLEVEQARSAVINAAASMDAPRQVRERALSAAKYSIGRIGTRVAEESIQMHGGIGMTWELPLAHYAKRLVMIDHQLGDEDHHLARYIALAN